LGAAMADIHVWADDPVTCSLTLSGVRYSKASDIQFVFAEGSKGEVGRAKATRSSSSATATWAKALGPEGDDLRRLLQYYVEVDGVAHRYFSQDIWVYAKTVTIEAKKEDGSPMVGAIAVIKQQVPAKNPDGSPSGETDTVTRKRKTDDKGKIEYRLTFPDEIVVTWERPWVLVKWTQDEGTKLSATVKELKFKALLATPRPPGNDKSKPYRQYVNQEEARNTPSYGNKLKVEVVGTSAYEGKEGDEVFLKAEYDGSNSDRTPAEGQKAKSGVTDMKAKLDRRRIATFEVPIGHAGGDRVKIKVGATSACDDDEVTVENWRRINYELMGPQKLVTTGRLAAATLGDGTQGHDYNKVIKDWAKERLDKVFVEYVCTKSHVYPDGLISASLNVDGVHFGATTGKKYFIFGSEKFTPAGVAFQRTDPLTINVRLCDRAFSPNAVAPFATDDSSDFTGTTGTVLAPDYLFPLSLENGGATVSGTWTAIVDATAYPDHPGIGESGNIEADWLDFKKGAYRLGVTLKGTAATLVGPASADKCPIRIELSWLTYYGINGSAGGGQQVMVMDRPDKPIACTICHELGHSMGMVPFESNAKGRKKPPPAGMVYPKTILEPGGDAYDDTHGHAGSHCANGCPDRPVGGAAFSFSGKEGTCIMFGSGGDEAEPKRANYCANCTKYIKARRLDDIRTAWPGRDSTTF
jgi:hypothetical protein